MRKLCAGFLQIVEVNELANDHVRAQLICAGPRLQNGRLSMYRCLGD